jgi:radical SAM superfamily enzyme YgiQ (UPF0313 family)
MEKVSNTMKKGLTLRTEPEHEASLLYQQGIKEGDILFHSRSSPSRRLNRVKLYFMLGQPTETMEDSRHRLSSP